MGNVGADGKELWLSGRFDKVVYEIDTVVTVTRRLRLVTVTGWLR